MSSQVTPEERFDRLIDWSASVTPRDEFLDAVNGEEQLRIKFGADITAPTLHIGHAVNLRVMRQMQDMGHRVVFLLGGFTTLVGDPTDKLQARSAPEISDMEKNKSDYIRQVGTLLQTDNPDRFEVRDNTEWWGGIEKDGTLNPLDLFRLLGKVSLSQLMARDMFRKRLENDTPIQMSEFLYPVLQGYDSVMMQSDVTIVGSDQLFNEQMGRYFQDKAGQDKQMIVCTKITPGLDGGPKQSKSIGNYVGIDHSPTEKYGRLMRLMDDLTPQWLEVYSDYTLAEIADMTTTYADEPLALKHRLAHNITSMFHGDAATEFARREFNKLMSRKIPAEVPEIQAPAGANFRSILLSQGYKSGNIRQFLDNKSLVIVNHVEEDGSYSEVPMTETDILAAAVHDMIVRVGKNRFMKIVAPQSESGPN